MKGAYNLITNKQRQQLSATTICNRLLIIGDMLCTSQSWRWTRIYTYVMNWKSATICQSVIACIY